MELLVSIFFTVLFIMLALTSWANRHASELQRRRSAATRLEGPLSIDPAPTLARREGLRGAAAPMRWAADALAQAGLDVAPGILVFSLVALTITGPMLARLWLPGNVAIAAGLSLPVAALIWLQKRRHSRLKTLASQIPYLIDTLKAALEAGHTMLRGLQMASLNSPEPLASEVRVVVDRVRVGMTLPSALEAMNRRVPIDELNFLADAVCVQEEAGSSMANILQHIAETVRNRQLLDDQIKVLTSQSRISALIVTVLPGIVLAVFSLFRGDYTDILFHDPMGNRILAAAIALDVTAFFIMRQIARVDY